jgi:hypothetical protein
MGVSFLVIGVGAVAALVVFVALVMGVIRIVKSFKTPEVGAGDEFRGKE